MKKFEFLVGHTIIEYRSQIFEALSKDEAISLFNQELEENSFIFYEWEIKDIKRVNDYEVLLVTELYN